MRLNLFVFTIFALVILINGESTSEQPEMDFETHFNHLSNKRHPYFNGGKFWREGREYIKKKMVFYGARDFQEQHFNTSISDDTVEGVNLIGVAEGEDVLGPVIVVGADYDTNLIGNPLKDNTGGVACLLETMHLFYDKIYYNQYLLNFTVIFVAFDLNTREYVGDSMGKSGSYFFIHEWLIPFLGNETIQREFLGAIILDSVTTTNMLNDTQQLSEGFDQAMPDAYVEIKNNGYKGDFLGFLFNSRDEENPIKQTFIRRYNMDRKKTPFRLQEMELHLKYEIIEEPVLETFNHQSHYYFWTNLEDGVMPAFLLFDTDDDRTDPTPDACSEVTCSVEDFLTKERIAFMQKTTDTLVSTILELQTSHYDFPENDGERTKSSAAFVTFTSLIFALVFKYF